MLAEIHDWKVGQPYLITAKCWQDFSAESGPVLTKHESVIPVESDHISWLRLLVAISCEQGNGDNDYVVAMATHLFMWIVSGTPSVLEAKLHH